jgi:TIR domain
MSGISDTVTDEQRTALRVIYNLLRDLGKWPPFVVVDHELDRLGLDAETVLSQLRASHVLFDRYLHPSSQVSLTVAGVIAVQRTESALDAAAFWRLVQFGLQALTEQRPDPERPDAQPVVRREDVEEGPDVEDGLPRDVALRAFLILQAEGISGGVSSLSAADGDWSFSVGRDFRRWRQAADLDAFVAARTVERHSALRVHGFAPAGNPTRVTEVLRERAPESASDPPAEPTARPLTVFLCHSSNDKERVRRLERRLRNDGYTTWLDEHELLPGQDWDREIRRAVGDTDVVVVCLSQGSVAKTGFVQKEILFVLDAADKRPEGDVFLIPARLEECEVPDRLSRWHRVDLFRRGGYNRLKRTLEHVKNIDPEP